ncbi:MAG: DUF4199 domain-containing protein [Bacteroidia bacterium]
MNRLAIKYALIAAIALVMWVMLEHEFGFNSERHDIGQYTRIISAFIFYIFIFLAIRERRKIQRGNLKFSQGFQTGALMVIIYGALSTCWFAAYSKFINPTFFETVMKFEMEELQKANASAEEIASTAERLSHNGSPLSFLFLFAFTCIGGLLMTLLFSYLLKTKKQV